jgi:hypothetical protein
MAWHNVALLKTQIATKTRKTNVLRARVETTLRERAEDYAKSIKKKQSQVVRDAVEEFLQRRGAL